MSAPAARPYSDEQTRVVDERIARQCHPKQRDFVFDPALWISLLCSRGSGKTLAAVMRLIRRMVRYSNQSVVFIAETREQAERLAWRDLKRIVASLRLGGVVFNESDLTCTLPNGSYLLLYGCDDKKDISKLRGVTWHEVIVDETASIKDELLEELLFEVIGARAVGPIVLQGTPGKRLAGLFYEVTGLGMPKHRAYADRERPDLAEWKGWSSHRWNIVDGVAYGIPAMVELHRKQQDDLRLHGWGPNHPRRKREYDGEWCEDNTQNVYAYKPLADDGGEWNRWAPERSQHGFAILPERLKDVGYGIGIDVGFKDAFALEVFAFSYTDPDRVLYHVYEVYRTRLYAQAIAKLLIGDDLNHDKYGGIVGVIGWPDAIVGDFAGVGGALLAELQQVYGITVRPADKPYKYKDNAIELFNGDLVDGKIKVIQGSSLEKELLNLQWAVDVQGRRAENKGQANHACDAALYIRNELAAMLPAIGGGGTPPPAAPKPDEDEAPRRQRPTEPDPVYRPEWGGDGYQPGEW